MDKQSIILFGIFLFGFASLFVIYNKMKEGFGNTNLKIYGITIIVFAALILAISDVAAEKTAACFGILGAIGGYLFGIRDKD
jgi:hypothetical protein